MKKEFTMEKFTEQLENLHTTAESVLLGIIQKHGQLSIMTNMKQIRISDEYCLSESSRLNAKVIFVNNNGYEFDLWDTFFTDWEIMEFLDCQIKQYITQI